MEKVNETRVANYKGVINGQYTVEYTVTKDSSNQILNVDAIIKKGQNRLGSATMAESRFSLNIMTNLTEEERSTIYNKISSDYQNIAEWAI